MPSTTTLDLKDNYATRETPLPKSTRYYQGRYYVTLPHITVVQDMIDGYQSRIHSRSVFMYPGIFGKSLAPRIRHTFSQRARYGYGVAPAIAGKPDCVRHDGTLYCRCPF